MVYTDPKEQERYKNNTIAVIVRDYKQLKNRFPRVDLSQLLGALPLGVLEEIAIDETQMQIQDQYEQLHQVYLTLPEVKQETKPEVDYSQVDSQSLAESPLVDIELNRTIREIKKPKRSQGSYKTDGSPKTTSRGGGRLVNNKTPSN